MAGEITEQESPNPVGRPTVYKPEYIEQANKLCLLGATDVELADFFDVTVTTLNRWKHTYPEFCASIKNGKEILDERVERTLYQKATGYDYKEQEAFRLKVEKDKEEVKVVDVIKHSPADTVACKFWLINRRKDTWREKSEVDHTSKGKEINFALKLDALNADDNG